MGTVKKAAKRVSSFSSVRAVRFDALTCKQNSTEFYVVVLPNDILKSTCFVSRREENPEKGFQRSLNESRAKDITKYLDEVKGIIPSALILSAQDSAKFSFDRNSNKVSFVTNSRSFMVLDGQHRLWGLISSRNKHCIPVVIFNKLNVSNEVKLFIDINTTQKGVPKTLILDIKNLAGIETKLEDRQRQLFDSLNKKSVLAGLMSAEKSRVGKISRTAFNQATTALFESGFFQNKDNETVCKGVMNYLEAAEKVFRKSKSDKAKLTNSILFRAVFAIFNEVIDKTLGSYSDLKSESIVNSLEPISRLSFDSYTGTSNATFQKVVDDMRSELNEYNNKYHDLNSSSLF